MVKTSGWLTCNWVFHFSYKVILKISILFKWLSRNIPTLQTYLEVNDKGDACQESFNNTMFLDIYYDIYKGYHDY